MAILESVIWLTDMDRSQTDTVPLINTSANQKREYIISENTSNQVTLPADIASLIPVSDKSASYQPQNRFFWFHSLSP